MLFFAHSAALRLLVSKNASTAPGVCAVRRRVCACAGGSSAGGVTRDQVEKVVRLAQLELGEGELDRLTPEFNKIVGFIDTLSELDLGDVEPMSRVEDSTNVLREDTPAAFSDV